MLAFIDESGKPHPADSCACSVLTAVCFSEKDSSEISRSVYNLKANYLGEAAEIKAKKILNERTVRRIPEKKAFLDALLVGLLRHLLYTSMR